MPDCDCGTEITAKNAAGHYRDKCQDCIEANAQREIHGMQCDKDDCIVCEDHLKEMQETIIPLYLETLRIQSNNQNKTLGDYQ